VTTRLWVATLTAAALTSCIPGAAACVRVVLAFTLTPHGGSPREVAEIAGTNLRVVIGLHVTAVLPYRAPRMLMIALLLANATAVGAAAAAYASGSLRYLVHLPLEWAAFGRAATGARLPAALAFLVLAAIAESYLTPQ
jgi:hypothetical protein